MKIKAIKCPKCGDVIFSRANHDFRGCSCGEISVDGGFSSYGGRILFGNSMPERVEVEVDATQKELYDDWNLMINKFGIIKGDT